LKKKIIFGTIDRTRFIKKSTSGNFVSFIFDLNINFRTINSSEILAKNRFCPSFFQRNATGYAPRHRDF